MISQATCSVCGTVFSPQFAFQLLATPRARYAFCTEACRKTALAASTPPAPPPEAPLRIAILNQKGGVGKTTTAVSLGSGLADRGVSTLLVDADAQGSVGMSLGIKGTRSLFHVLMEDVTPQQASVPVRSNLDVLTADEMLANAEIRLAQQPKRANVMSSKLAAFTGYKIVLVDCAPSLSLLNQNALVFADYVLVPVACDYLSLVGLKQLLRTIKHVQTSLGHVVELGAVLPTMYDGRSKHAQESLKALQDHFGPRCLAPVRMCVKLKEAPAQKRTIFEYASDSTAAKDYLKVVEWTLSLALEHKAGRGLGPSAPATWPSAPQTLVPQPASSLTPRPVDMPPPDDTGVLRSATGS